MVSVKAVENIAAPGPFSRKLFPPRGGLALSGLESSDRTLAVNVFRTQLGWMVLSGWDDVVDRLCLGYRSPEQALESILPTLGPGAVRANWQPDLARRLSDFAQGARDDFRDVRLRQIPCTPFQQRVLDCCRRIPYGEVRTYRELAAEAGIPKAARAVGNVMAHNRIALIIPCHRVVASGGGLGGYSGWSGVDLKRRLLELESAGLC
jgi:O-6-methylguanine DNA methyltransferase